MQQSRHRRNLRAVVAVTAIVGLSAIALPQFATATAPHMRALGVAVVPATPPASLPAGPSPAACVTAAGCDLYAKPGTVTAGTASGIPIWGFTTDNVDPAGGRLGGDPLNTIIISDADTLKITLHNELPSGAGNLSLEVPAAQGPPDIVGAAVGSSTPYTIGPLDAGTYVYQAGSTVEQPRQLAMGLAAIIIVRPSVLGVPDTTSAYSGGMGTFDDEAIVVMNEIDPAFNNAPLTSDVEDYTPHYFFINGKAHPLTDDIAANAGDTVLLRVANLGIRDRALGLVNSRLTLIGDDSHDLAESNRVDLESKLLTPGQVADVTTMVDPAAPVGAQFALLDLNRHLNNSGEGGMGGMLTFIDVVGTPVAAGAPAAHVTALTPSTNDGTVTVSVTYTITGTATTAQWFLDDLGGTCTGTVAATAGPNTELLAPAILSVVVCGPKWTTGDHVLWIQPADGTTVGSASGGVFTLALQGPSVSGLSTDPQFAGLSNNKVDTDPTSTDVILTGSAQPSLLDYEIDGAEACLTDPALTAGTCPSTIPVGFVAPVVPSHTDALRVRIPVASFPAPNAIDTIYVRAHEIPTTSGVARWSDWGSPNSTVDITIDHIGPTVSNFTSTPDPAGIGNYPGNLNFLESVRIQVDLTDSASPIADAELFLDQAELDGTGSQLRPLAGQWLDDLTVHTRTAYLEVPISELQARPQGPVAVFIHAKDAAGNWGTPQEFSLQLDKTNPMILGTTVDAGNHTFLPDETGLALASGDITINSACDPNGVSSVGACPATSGAIAPNAVSSGIGEIRYHVSAVTGTIGTVGAGIFYQTAQIAPLNAATVTSNGDGTVKITFNWHILPQPPLPIDAASSVWVWVVDAAGNPSVPVEVPVGPPTP